MYRSPGQWLQKQKEKNYTVSHKKAAQEQREIEKRERNWLHNQECGREEKKITNRPYKTTTEEITQKNNMKQVRDEAHTKVQARKDIIPDKYHERKENQNKDDALWERITRICKQDSKEVVNG